MKPRVTVITLGVDDLERALTFYPDGLGLATKGVVGEEFEHGAVVFIDLQVLPGSGRPSMGGRVESGSAASGVMVRGDARGYWRGRPGRPRGSPGVVSRP